MPVGRSPASGRLLPRDGLIPPPRDASQRSGDVTPVPSPPRPSTMPPFTPRRNIGNLPVVPAEAETNPRSRPQTPADDDDDDEEDQAEEPTLQGQGMDDILSLQDAFRLLTQVVLQGRSNPAPSTSTSIVPAFHTPEMKKPDSFDGSSAAKLRTYLQQCKLIFLNDPSMFATEIQKTVYASSYLSGKAFEWIQPFLSNMSDDPDFLMNSWDSYEGQLLTLFGDPNELQNTENELDSLYMKDSDNASSYIASFRSLESRLEGWSDRALMHSFRKGLPSRILDLLDQQPGDINTLSELVNATLKIDI